MEAQTNKSKQTENIEKIKYLWEKEYQKRKVDSNKIKNITSKWKEQYKDKIIKKELNNFFNPSDIFDKGIENKNQI